MAQNKQEILADLDFLSEFRGVVDAYQQIAASRMRKIRESVVGKRDFLQELSDLFKDIKGSFKKEIEKLVREKKIRDPSQFSFLERNGRTAYVLLTSNIGLYGEIIRKTFDKFLANFDSSQGEPVIIGKFGKVLFEEAMPGIEFTYFDFPEDSIELENFRWIMEYIIRYQRVLVFYGKFLSLLTQEADTISISGDEIKIEEGEPVAEYLFEPSGKEIMIFFETQILASMFEQTVYEAQLAKFASRMSMLQQAGENIDNDFKNVSLQKLKIEHREQNRKQLQTLAGALWSTR